MGALTAEPKSAASWPSLYKALCKIAKQSGFKEKDTSAGEQVQAVLVSQLKSLLQQHWHGGFDESALSYFTEQGKCMRIKKMKHLLNTLLEWREQRVSSASRSKSKELDQAL